MLTTLLRKKAAPEVDEWINNSKAIMENKNLNLLKDDELITWCLATIQDLRDEFQFYGFHTVDELDYMETPQGKQEAKEKKDKEHERDQAELKITSGGKKSLHLIKF